MYPGQCGLMPTLAERARKRELLKELKRAEEEVRTLCCILEKAMSMSLARIYETQFAEAKRNRDSVRTVLGLK